MNELINVLTAIAVTYLGLIVFGVIGFILIFREIRRRNKETQAMRERFDSKRKHQIDLSLCKPPMPPNPEK